MNHPSTDMLNAFNNQSLSDALCVAVAAHLEMCTSCFHKQKRTQLFSKSKTHDAQTSLDCIQETLHKNLSQIKDRSFQPNLNNTKQVVEIDDEEYELPYSLSVLPFKTQEELELFSMLQVDVTDGAPDIALLHVKAGAPIEKHTHDGYELCVMLSGKYKDEFGEHTAGDFAFLDDKTHHHPEFLEDTICLLVTLDKRILLRNCHDNLQSKAS